MRGLLIALAAVVGVWLIAVVVLIVAGRRSAAREIATLVPNLIRLFRGLIREPRVRRRSKTLVALGLVWLASPIDLIPEFLPVVGPLDDAIVAALLLRHLVRRAGRTVVAEHWQGDPATLERILRLARASE
ncbi:MAG: YkvA family protein [Actinomycetota bacterium]